MKKLIIFEVKQNYLIENISVRMIKFVIEDPLNFQNMTRTLIQKSFKNVLSNSRRSNSDFF